MLSIMSKELSMDTAKNSINYNLRTKEETRARLRRQHLLYLIADYLENRGFTKSATTLITEAQLSNNVKVCDNINLEKILIDYEIYYDMKYYKLPLLCQNVEAATARNTICRTNVAESNGKQNDGKIVKISKYKTEENLSELMFPLSVKQIFSDQQPSIKQPYGTSLPSMRKTIIDLYGDNSEMQKIAESISREILENNLNVHWDDVKGLQECKEIIKNAVVYPFKYPTLFLGQWSWKSILMAGPPGTGKTMLARATATECKCTFFNVSASSLISKWRGDSEKYVRVLFELAYARAPTIIFIDEIDWIATNVDCSYEPARRFRAELLVRMDGLTTTDDRNVVLLAATNAPRSIDTALSRRIDKTILVPMPDSEAIVDILKTYTWQIKEEELEYFVREKIYNFTGSDIKKLCKQAWIHQVTPMIKTLEETHEEPKNVPRRITSVKYLQMATENIYPTIDSDEIGYWLLYQKNFEP